MMPSIAATAIPAASDSRRAFEHFVLAQLAVPDGTSEASRCFSWQMPYWQPLDFNTHCMFVMGVVVLEDEPSPDFHVNAILVARPAYSSKACEVEAFASDINGEVAGACNLRYFL
ncbi:hypothetical protein IFT68_00735 [Oxalobacteraceae sp. CFBP 13730]|nr:hypothetical protein [Oxalobacteraceae sp. CFBP 13730]